MPASHPALQHSHWYKEDSRDYDNDSIYPSIKDLKEIYFNDKGKEGIKKLLSAPFVIRKAAQKWGWNLKRMTTRMLAMKFGTAKADFYPHNMGAEKVYPIMTSLGYALKQLRLPDAVFSDIDVYSGGATYIQWNLDESSWIELLRDLNASLPSLLDDRYWMKRCFSDMRNRDTFGFKTHWRMLLIGNENAGMFNHRDSLSTASWQMQLKGRKQWHICAPQEEGNVYAAGDVDCFSPDYEKYPKMLNATCYQTTVTPGDLIYYPKGYWHQTKNLSPVTISITDTMVGHDSHADVAEELTYACAGAPTKLKRVIFSPDAEMCSALDSCYTDWAEMYSTTTENPGSVDNHLISNTVNMDEF
jgi:hypothetical protein